MGLDLGSVMFMYNGKRMFGSTTPWSLGIRAEATILVLPADLDMGYSSDDKGNNDRCSEGGENS